MVGLSAGTGAFASPVVCSVVSQDEVPSSDGVDKMEHWTDTVRADCTGDYSLRVQIDGKGIGYRVSVASTLKFFCSNPHPWGTYHGVKVDFDTFVGIGVALYQGDSGYCFMFSSSLPAEGLDITGSQLTIE